MCSKAVVKFTTSIYDIDALQKAASDYKSICDIEVSMPDSEQADSSEQQYMICTLSNSRADMQLTVKEFCNYVIEQMNVRRT